MFLTPTDPVNIIDTAKTLKRKTSSGFDEISKKLFDIIEDMKIAKVIPIHKSGEISNFNNYRPISLLSAFSKLLEKVVIHS